MATVTNPTAPGLAQPLPNADRRHALSISALAQELALPLEHVAVRYEAALRELMADARIADYLPILAAKRVRAFFKSEKNTCTQRWT